MNEMLVLWEWQRTVTVYTVIMNGPLSQSANTCIQIYSSPYFCGLMEVDTLGKHTNVVNGNSHPIEHRTRKFRADGRRRGVGWDPLRHSPRVCRSQTGQNGVSTSH